MSAPRGARAGGRGPGTGSRCCGWRCLCCPTVDRWGERRRAEEARQRLEDRAGATGDTVGALPRGASSERRRMTAHRGGGGILGRAVVEDGASRAFPASIGDTACSAGTTAGANAGAASAAGGDHRRRSGGGVGGTGAGGTGAETGRVLPATRSGSSARYLSRWLLSGRRSSAPDRPCCRGYRPGRRWRCCTTRRW